MRKAVLDRLQILRREILIILTEQNELRVGSASLMEQIHTPPIAVPNLRAVSAGHFNLRGLDIHHGDRHAVAHQHLRYRLPKATKADHYGTGARSMFGAFRRFSLHLLPLFIAFYRHQQERGGSHGYGHNSPEKARGLRLNEQRGLRLPEQNKTKFTPLAEQKPKPNRLPPRRTKPAGEQRDNAELH